VLAASWLPFPITSLATAWGSWLGSQHLRGRGTRIEGGGGTPKASKQKRPSPRSFAPITQELQGVYQPKGGWLVLMLRRLASGSNG